MEKQEDLEKEIQNMSVDSYEFNILADMDIILNSIKNKYSISEENKNIIDGELTLFLIKKTKKELFMENMKQQLSFELEISLIEKIISDIFIFIDKKRTEKDGLSISPAQALASIKERLGSTSSVAPITRDYSFTKNETPKESVTEALKVDPYRELPER